MDRLPSDVAGARAAQEAHDGANIVRHPAHASNRVVPQVMLRLGHAGGTVSDLDDLTPPPEPYDRAEELAILREALEDVKAGRGTPFDEFMAQLAAEYKLPPVPPE